MNYMSDEQKKANTAISGGYGNPWLTAGKLIVGGASSNLDQGGAGGAQGVNEMNKTNRQQPGMQMGAAANTPKAEEGIISEFNDSLLPGSERLIGKNVAPTPSVAGGWAIQPTTVDSSKRTGMNSGEPSYGMKSYLSYMGTRGGYR